MKDFIKYFTGLKRNYGFCNIHNGYKDESGKIKFEPKDYGWAKKEITDQDYEEHLNGVKSIGVKLNIEERTFAESNVATSSGSKTITFTNPFFEVPALGIAAQNMQTGDVFTITSKSVNGFTIAFVNSSGSAVDRTFDYIAKGFGLQS